MGSFGWLGYGLSHVPSRMAIKRVKVRIHAADTTRKSLPAPPVSWMSHKPRLVGVFAANMPLRRSSIRSRATLEDRRCGAREEIPGVRECKS